MEDNKTPKNEIIEKIKNQLLNEFHEDDGYEIISNLRWGPTSSSLFLDLVIKQNGLLLAVFIITNSANSANIKRNNLAHILLAMPDGSLPLIINYNYGGEHRLYHISIPFPILKALESKFPKRKLKSDYNYENLNEVIQLIEDTSAAKNELLLEKSTDDISSEQPKFYKSNEQVLDPEWCREQLGEVTCKNEQLEKIRCKEICRYSSLDSLFSSLKHKTIRMNGLPGMNDRTEGLFAWGMIYKLESADNEANKKRRRETNNVFIVSYSSSNLIDDLTQWRLYGNDAKGVCCVYSILEEKLKDRFYLHNVRYIKKSDKSEDISDEVLKLFLEYSKDHPLSYYDLSPAIFFYKLDAFKSEDEIRLLVDNKKTSAYSKLEYKREWLLTNANNIPNPYIDVPLEDIPLKLERIILGPNMNDVDTIQAQLETMLKQQGIDAEVILSSIDSYRNPTK